MSNMPGWDRGDGGFPLRPTQLKVNYMSDLKDFELGGYHNAGGGMTGEAMTKPSVDEVEALKAVTTALIAAVSLLRQDGKKAAPSDRMFEQMLLDYENAIKQGRAALRARPQVEPSSDS
jgi:hypothetical protein